MVYLSWLLWFESNLEAKNEVIPAGEAAAHLEKLVMGLGCKVGELPST